MSWTSRPVSLALSSRNPAGLVFKGALVMVMCLQSAAFPCPAAEVANAAGATNGAKVAAVVSSKATQARTVLSSNGKGAIKAATGNSLAGSGGAGALPIVKHDFSKEAERFFQEWFKLEPSLATQYGLHEHDQELEDFSRATYERQLALLDSYLKIFNGFDRQALSRDDQIDRVLLINYIRGKLLSLRDLQSWKRNPDHYTSLVSASIFNLVKRNFAPLPERLELVVSRERQIPRVLKQAQENLSLELVPQIYVEVALEQLPGIVAFFEKSVPEAFGDVADPTLQQTLSASTGETVSALKSYQSFLKKNLLEAGCKGSFALGEMNYRKKLAYDEMVSEPIPQLLSRGEAESKRLQDEFEKVGKGINSDLSASDTFRSIAVEHPKPDQLISDVKNVLEKIRRYCIEKDLVTIPGEKRPIVEESPPFMRALTFASLDVAGPLEKKATETFYNVTLPAPDWSAEKTEEHMRSFSFPDVLNTSIHEAYPGHFVQYLVGEEAPSTTRKLLGCASNDEGWAHYCEQMMVEEGFEGGDPKYRMVQIHDALLRVCRYIVGLRMHTRNMTLDQGVQFFIKEGYQEKTNAEREAKRGTMDPTYLVYTLGKLEILKLRDDYRKLRGSHFTIKEFHDRFLRVGYPPLKLVRATLLNEEIPDSISL
ncbi:MAG TPA: DUF885 domain-containing protein, partial [Chroococcales cyanobacterium]